MVVVDYRHKLVLVTSLTLCLSGCAEAPQLADPETSALSTEDELARRLGTTPPGEESMDPASEEDPTVDNTVEELPPHATCQERDEFEYNCSLKPHKRLVCKVPPGNPSNEHEICISEHAVQAQINTGSRLGRCDEE